MYRIHDLIELLKQKEEELGNLEVQIHVHGNYEEISHTSITLPEFEVVDGDPGLVALDFYCPDWKPKE